MASRAESGEIRVMGMGEQGVQVAKGPLHGEPGDVMSAQNATFLGADERGGLAKRQGMSKFTASALAGTVLAILSVTFADGSISSKVLLDGAGDILTDEAFLVLTE